MTEQLSCRYLWKINKSLVNLLLWMSLRFMLHVLRGCWYLFLASGPSVLRLQKQTKKAWLVTLFLLTTKVHVWSWRSDSRRLRYALFRYNLLFKFFIWSVLTSRSGLSVAHTELLKNFNEVSANFIYYLVK